MKSNRSAWSALSGTKSGVYNDLNSSIARDDGYIPFRTVFGILLVLLLIIALFRSVVISSVSSFSFSSLLQVLNSAPVVDISKPISLTITGDWGIVDFLRNFLNTISSVFEVSIWFAKVIMEVVQYVLYLFANILGITGIGA